MEDIRELLWRIPLGTGTHQNPYGKLCVMECVAFVAGEPHSDHPKCACDVATALAIQANDTRLPELGAALSQRVLRLAGSNKGDAVTKERAYFLVDYIFRTLMPELLRRRAPEAGLDAPRYHAQADALAAFPPIRLDTELHKARSAWNAVGKFGVLNEYSAAKRYLTDLLYKLRIDEFRSVGETFGELDNALGHPFNILTVLDAVLDIGDTKPVAVTEPVAKRITALARAAAPALPA